jgi:hypothetical protein
VRQCRRPEIGDGSDPNCPDQKGDHRAGGPARHLYLIGAFSRPVDQMVASEARTGSLLGISRTLPTGRS